MSTVHTDPDTGIQTIDPAYEAWVQEAVAHPEAFLDAVIERQIAAELARLRVLDHHGNGVDRLVALLAERQQHAVCAIGGDAWEAAAGR